MKKTTLALITFSLIVSNAWATKTVTYSHDTDMDGQPDKIRVQYIDDQNRTTSQTWDDDADSVVDRVETYTYTANGSTAEIRNATTNALLFSRVYINDANGRPESMTMDNDGDGSPDLVVTRNYVGTGTDNLTISYSDGVAVTHSETIVTVEQ